jgi:hypothetical protein
MADVGITAFNATPVNGTTTIGVAVARGASPEAEVSVTASKRRNAAGTFEHISIDPLDLRFEVWARDLAADYDAWKSQVESLFQPWTSNATRVLAGTLPDGTPVSLDVIVIRRRKVHDTGSVGSVLYHVDLRAENPLWRKTTDSTTTGNPTNAGNAPAPATIELTTATHKQIRQCSVAGAGAGGGLMGYPVKLAYTQSGITAGEAFAYVNGSNTPTYSDDYSAYLWTIVDTSQDATQATTLDLVTIDGAINANPLGGRLEQGGMKLGDAVIGTDSSNSVWAWNDFSISQNPIRCGSWRPAVTGADKSGSFELNAESPTGLTFLAYSQIDSLARNADSMALVFGAQGNSLAGLTRICTNHTPGAGPDTIRSYARVRPYGSGNWAAAWSTVVDGTFSSSISLANAVEVAVGIEVFTPPSYSFFGSLALSAPGTGGVFSCSLNAAPTVTVGTAQAADYFNGTITNGATGESIECREVVLRDGTLSLDSLRRVIYSSLGATEAIYGDWRFSNDDNWFLLVPGSNAITNGITGAAYTARWREAYA